MIVDAGMWGGRRFRIKFMCNRGHITLGTATLLNAIRFDGDRLRAVLGLDQDRCAAGCPLLVREVMVPGPSFRAFPISLVRDEVIGAAVIIDYTNHRGERSRRRIRPLRIWFGANQWHPDEQWLLAAIDLDRNAERDFALTRIHAWERS